MKSVQSAVFGLIASGFFSLASAAFVVTYNPGNTGYGDLDGTSPLVGGYLHAGSYAGDPIALGLNSEELRDQLQLFGSLPNASDGTGYITTGNFEADVMGPWAGQRIYLVATDTQNHLDATQIAVFTNTGLSSWEFQSLDIDPPKNVSMDNDIIGNGNARILAGAETVLDGFPTIQLAPVIPEPSTSLLALLGLAGLLHRRR